MIKKKFTIFLLIVLLSIFPLCNAWIWTAEDFEFKCSDTNTSIKFGSDFYSYPVDVDRNYWTFHNITMGDGEALEYLMFSGQNCNVTLTELNENKLYVASVSDASSSSIVSLESSSSHPYVQNVSGAITALEVYFIEDNLLNWSITGDGPTTIIIPCEGNTPYYLKINGSIKEQGDVWSVSENVVTVVDTLGSTHDYELSFAEIPSPPSPPDDPSPPEPSTPPGSGNVVPEPLVEKIIGPIVFGITDNFIAVVILVLMLLFSVLLYRWEYVTASKILFGGFVFLALNFGISYLLVPMNLLPDSLSFLGELSSVLKPPTLQLATFSVDEQNIIQILFMLALAPVAIATVFYAAMNRVDV